MRASQRIFLKKCTFLSSKVIFLGFVGLAQGVEADLDKIKAIIDWPLPKTIHEIWSFHGLVAFIFNFGTIMTPITDCMKKVEFNWIKAVARAFEQIKQKMTKAHILKLSNFAKVVKS